MSRPSISIVIPAHNEEQNLPKLIGQILKIVGSDLKEILIVDDCSTDSTPQLADELARKYGKVKAIHRKPPGGLGRAIRAGFARATGNYVVTMDADFEMLPQDVPKMFKKMRDSGCDAVVGSRFMGGSVLRGYSRMKLVYNRVFNFVFRALLWTGISDLTFGFKVLSKRVVRSIRWTATQHGIATETTVMPIAMGYRVCELPVSWIRRKHGKSSFKVSYNLQYVKMGLRAVARKWRRALK